MICVNMPPSHWRKGKKSTFMTRCQEFWKMTHCRVTPHKYVGNSRHLRGWDVPLVASLTKSPIPHLWSPFLCLPSLYSCYQSPVSRFHSPVSPLPTYVQYLQYIEGKATQIVFCWYFSWALRIMQTRARAQNRIASECLNRGVQLALNLRLS